MKTSLVMFEDYAARVVPRNFIVNSMEIGSREL
jgi:hypothetical protein